jgi:hypothetical protein
MSTMRDIVQHVPLHEGYVKFVYFNSLEASLFTGKSAGVLMDRLEMTNFDVIFKVNSSFL